MKTRFLLFFTFFLFACSGFSQQYGAFIHDTDNSLTQGYITWWKILTGPSDGGVFTHLGYWDDETYNCALSKMALYSHDIANDKPDVFLAETASAASIDAAYNNKPLLTNPTLDPNTFYWVGYKGSISCYMGEEAGANWPYPVKYKNSVYGDPWPTTTGISSLSTVVKVAIFAIGNGMPLPVEMISFNGKYDTDRTILEWTTAVEMNNEGWNVQRSSNGFTWNTIGWVEGNGNTREELNYRFEDVVPNFGANFYRLEQKDFDGKTAYSDVVSVNRKSKERKLFPNPVQDELYHTGIEEGEYSIFDVTGRNVQSGALTSGTPIEVRNLLAGVYSIVTIDSNGLKKRHTIIKRK